MKIQSLAVMFIIMILPISLVLASYTQNRVETLGLQAEYDSKLNDATYDALKAYQLNSFNSETSDFANSKMRDIKASVNIFFNTMSSSFSSLGYTKETLQNYIPAIVYTMYDGYYIYSPYNNIWDQETVSKHSEDPSYSGTLIDATSKEKLYGLKPYVYYSSRYSSNDYDVTITYSLDNYIQIQGYIVKNGVKKTVSKYGYVLNKANGISDTKGVYYNEATDVVKYNGIEITNETPLKEYIYVDGNLENLPYVKINGRKYYKKGNEVFYILNGKKIPQSGMNIDVNTNAKEYYKEAYKLIEFIESNLSNLSTNNIVESDNNYYKIAGKIFDFSNIESETSNFNTHRIDVIKNSIERNLSIAISNFNNFSNSTTDFQMPKLKDSDWDKIMDNISIISFLQGINIGGKIYNGYSIVTNTKNEDIVMEDSIYIQTTDDNVFHRITETGLTSNNIVGIYNINVERRTAEDTNGNTKYYFPVYGTLSYDSIVTQNNIAKGEDVSLSNYISGLSNNLKKVYYTALGRERYGLYRQKLEIDNTN